MAIAIFVIPDKDSDRHSEIKNTADIKVKIPSKCFVLKYNDNKKIEDKSTLTNFLCSINSKLGGESWIISPEHLKKSVGDLNGICVMGLDVAHGDTRKNKKSVVALVASYNTNFTHYIPSISYQEPGQEIVKENLKKMIIDVLNKYKIENGKLPSQIIFYRDGVGEGMYEIVGNKEIAQLEETCKEIYNKELLTSPKITFIIAQKRTHFRSFLQDNSGTVYNPYSGTMISKMVVDKGKPNFYLFSHDSTAGTSKPTHYVILRNDTGRTIEQLGNFTYCLSFLHQGNVKIYL